MASLNRVSLDTDVIFLRKMFAFNPDGMPVASNTILAAGAAGDISAQNILDVLEAATYPTYGNLVDELDAINAQIVAGPVQRTEFDDTIADLRTEIRDASAAYVIPLSDLSAATAAEFTAVYSTITNLQIAAFNETAVFNALLDLSASTAASFASANADISSLNVSVTDLSAAFYPFAARTDASLNDLQQTSTANYQSLSQAISDLSGTTAQVYVDIQADLSATILSVKSELDQFYTDMSNLNLDNDVVFGKSVRVNGQLRVDTSGSVLAPAISFTNPDEGINSATGLYHPADGTLAVAVDAINTANFNKLSTEFKNIIDATTGVKVSDGTAALPAISFAADLDTGIWRPAANAISITSGGKETITCTNGSTRLTGQTIIDGSCAVISSSITIKPFQMFGMRIGTTLPSDNYVEINNSGTTYNASEWVVTIAGFYEKASGFGSSVGAIVYTYIDNITNRWKVYASIPSSTGGSVIIQVNFLAINKAFADINTSNLCNQGLPP